MKQPLRVLISCRPEETSDRKRNEQNDAAFEFAAWLARTSDINVRGITTFIRPWPSTSISKLGGKYHKWFKNLDSHYRNRTVKGLKESGVEKSQWDDDVSVFVDGPSESTLLTHAAEEFDADLILLSSDAAAPKGRFLASSTADALLHSSPVPLGLVPRGVNLSKKGVTRVNYAFTNESDDFEQGLNYAAELASTWNVPLRILSFSPAGITSAPTSGSLDLSTELSSEWRELTLALLDRARYGVLQDHGALSVSSEVGSGWGWSGAIDALKWKKGDLLCLGSHRTDALSRVFVGSETMEIIRNSPVPTIIYPGR
ncbi:universal stress protein [Corynebacterium crudilactis]|uniref:Universal stress protein n=1 Tax=Corynebacterium crudilactis TaxID=1652495 RepID=A0A172QWN4_9CORY|nr:universal stress protein [Corynebacterium crudilactis]ANE05117.1 universal stress protein [Corynebacterium crudilactis]